VFGASCSGNAVCPIVCPLLATSESHGIKADGTQTLARITMCDSV